MSKNVIINGRKFETYENYEGELVVKRAMGNSNFLVSELEELGVTVEDVKPKFEDLPAGVYQGKDWALGMGIVYVKMEAGYWVSTYYGDGRPEEAEQDARQKFDRDQLRPLAWAEATE